MFIQRRSFRKINAGHRPENESIKKEIEAIKEAPIPEDYSADTIAGRNLQRSTTRSGKASDREN